MKYTVLSNLRHDGKLYRRGETVELETEQAETLEFDGVITSEKVDAGELKATDPAATELSTSQSTDDSGNPTQTVDTVGGGANGPRVPARKRATAKKVPAAK